MHMADALVSPTVGGVMWAASASLVAYSARRLKEDSDEGKAPLMGVLGAFVFAAQMINFTIPGTGSSGHLGGGMLLAILMGPYAAFLTMASILTVQALFFADGGLLALGCNIFNLGFFPCFIALPFLYRPIVRRWPGRGGILAGSLVAAIVALQLGALAVVLETVASGIAEIPLRGFLLLMQPIHLAIGVVEGLVTAAVVAFVAQARPELVTAAPPASGRAVARRTVLLVILAGAVVTAGSLSWFASSYPDGLEWSLAHISGTEEPAAPQDRVHSLVAAVQEKIALLPDYGFKQSGGAAPAATPVGAAETKASWPAERAGTSVAGLVGGALTLCSAALLGFGLRYRRRKS